MQRPTRMVPKSRVGQTVLPDVCECSCFKEWSRRAGLPAVLHKQSAGVIEDIADPGMSAPPACLPTQNPNSVIVGRPFHASEESDG